MLFFKKPVFKKRVWTWFKVFFTLSLVLNLLLISSIAAVLTQSEAIRFIVYQRLLAPRLGSPQIAFIGDSITHGGGLWGLRLKQYNFKVWNLGEPGATTLQVQNVATLLAQESKTKTAFVMGGINDSPKTAESAQVSFQNYQGIIKTLLAAKIHPVIQLTLYRQNDPQPEFVTQLNQLLRDYALKHNLVVIDLNSDLAPQKSLLPQYTSDGLHLTEAAYQVWAQRILESKLF
jgi:lysophospholipase L1-like esterase